MPYHQNPQQAFQQAQEGTKDVIDVFENLDYDGSAYGHQLNHLKHEINEAYQQIENAMEVATDHQRIQLQKFQTDLKAIVDEVNKH